MEIGSPEATKYMKTYHPSPEFTRQTRSQTKDKSAQKTEQKMSQENATAGPSNGSEANGEGRLVNLPKFDSKLCEKFDPKTTDAHTWLHKFIFIATFYKWDNAHLCFFFGLHLLSDAYNWFSNLPSNISSNFEQLKEQFINRFTLNGATKWSIMPEIYDMKQKSDQPVQEFIQKLQMKAKLIDLPEDQIIGALMKGFLPHIRSDLIRLDIQSIADVIKEASISEQAYKIKGSQSDNILSEERLVKAIHTAMSINNLQTTSPSEQSIKPNNHKPNTKSRPQQMYNNYNPNTYNRPSEKVSQNYICFRCDRQGLHYHKQCPFRNAKCHSCSEIGHIQTSRACKRKTQQ